MALGAEAAAGPVEVVLAGQVGVHVPLVVLGVVLREEERVVFGVPSGLRPCRLG